jgi:DNA-binding beta-propeller fold protein YncE
VGVADTSSRLVADVGSSLAAVAVTHGRLFVADNRGRRVLVLDAASGARERTLRMPGPVRGVLAGLGSVWVTAGDAVVRLDPATLNRRSVTEVGGEAAQLALAGTSVLVTNRVDTHVTALDAGGAVVAVTDVHGPSIGVTVTDRQIWVLRTDSPTVTVVSRERLLPTGSLTLPGVGYDAAVVGNEVWVTVAETGTVARLSLAGAALGQLTVGRRPLGIEAGSGSVWVANEGESTLWRLSSALATVGP